MGACERTISFLASSKKKTPEAVANTIPQSVNSSGTTIDAALFGTSLTQSQLREPRSLTVTILNPIPNRRLLFHGEPIASDINTKNVINTQSNDIIGVTPKDRLKPNMTYTTVGAISVAPIQSILSTSLDYPSHIKEHYLQLVFH